MKYVILLSLLFLLQSCSIGTYEGKTAEEWKNEYDTSQSALEDTQNTLENTRTALSEANDNIEEANSNIEDAQSYAGGTYEDMNYALDDISTVDTVEIP